jgi:hypothetical protein
MTLVKRKEGCRVRKLSVVALYLDMNPSSSEI